MRAAMWKLHRYYLREVTVNAAITFTVLFAIVLLSLVARGLQKAQGGGLFEAALIMLFWALDMFPHLLTISFLLATVLTFARAVQDREIVAIRSAGIPPRVPMTAALLVGMVLSVVSSLAQHYVLPEVHFRKYRVIGDVTRTVMQNLNLGSDRIRFGDFVMEFRRQDQQRAFLDCTVYVPPKRMARLRDAGFYSSIVMVDRIPTPLVDERSDTLEFKLEGLHDPVTGSYLANHSYTQSLHALLETGRRNERDDDLSSDQLLAEVARGVHEAPTAAWYTLYRRSCFAIMPVLLAPIGFCIAQLAYHKGRMIALLASIVPLAVFYTGDVLGAKLLRSTDSPLFGLFPAMLLVALGVPFCVRTLRL
jgi:lipopolysaccharide export LptBFGC system permease protein LptF